VNRVPQTRGRGRFEMHASVIEAGGKSVVVEPIEAGVPFLPDVVGEFERTPKGPGPVREVGVEIEVASKTDVGGIIRQGLDMIEKEG